MKLSNLYALLLLYACLGLYNFSFSMKKELQDLEHFKTHLSKIYKNDPSYRSRVHQFTIGSLLFLPLSLVYCIKTAKHPSLLNVLTTLGFTIVSYHCASKINKIIYPIDTYQKKAARLGQKLKAQSDSLYNAAKDWFTENL